MHQDLRPYWLKKAALKFSRWYCQYFLQPRCAAFGPYANVMKPWYVNIWGPNIEIGRSFTAVGEPMHRIELCVWGREADKGRVTIGDCVLISPGVRISASDEITIGDGCMIANGVYITDSDWHTVYNRMERSSEVTPVHIGRNVWIGDRATVLKGVSIGDNSVIAASAVVTRDVPPNVIVAGNPARIVKALDVEREMVTRMDIFADPLAVARYFDQMDRERLAGNSFWRWLRGVIHPRSRPDAG